jgi:hypothetical protein
MNLPWKEQGFWKWFVGLFKFKPTPTPNPTPAPDPVDPTPEPVEIETSIFVVRQEREPSKGVLWVYCEKLPWAVGSSAFFWPDGTTKICDGTFGMDNTAMIFGTSTKLADLPPQYLLRVWPRFEWVDNKHYLPAETLLVKP